MQPMRSASVRQRHALRRGLRSIAAYAFFDLLTDSSMLDQVESQLPAHRERLLPPTETLAMCLAQALSADRSCQHAVNAFVARRVAGGLSACSTSTGAFCRAQSKGTEVVKRVHPQALRPATIFRWETCWSVGRARRSPV